MGDLFNEYETQFINLLSRIRQGNEEGLETKLALAEELLRKMDLEARVLPSTAREERKEVVTPASHPLLWPQTMRCIRRV